VAVTVVAAVRHGEGEPLPATAFIHLDVLGREAATELVGPARVDELYARSKGHPLFLTELAQQSAGTELPASLLESVSARCAELGSAGALLRTAAVIGPELDLDLLAAMLGRGAVELLDDVERAAAKQFLVEEDGTFMFRHELVREALAASASVAADAVQPAPNRADTRQVGDRLFVWRDGTWTDLRHERSRPVVTVEAFSDAYFELLRALPELGLAAVLEPAVLVAGRRVSVKIGREGKTAWDEGELARIVNEFRS